MKRFFTTLFILGILAAAWYLFIKEYDYQINFKGAYGPASIYYDLLDAEASNTENITAKKNFTNIIQHKTLGDTLYTFEWLLKPETDSTTQITVNIKDESNPFAARLNVLNPFDDFYSSNLKHYFIQFNKNLSQAQSAYAVKLGNKEKFEGGYCICASSRNKLNKKATEMTGLLSVIQQFFDKNNVKPSGNPLLYVSNWDVDNSEITFEFCFPINQRDSLETTTGTTLKTLPSFNALTAEFTGNYAFSHRSWADLLLKAKREDIPVKKNLIEVYYNNPMVEIEATKWKSKIYMPLK